MNLLLFHVMSCAWMTGLIWLIQVLHYPVFHLIEVSEFPRFHARHTQQITYLVGPMMVFELGTGLALIRTSGGHPVWVINFLMIVLIWICTGCLSVPIHNSLAQGKDSKKIERLILTNWPRTFLWSFRFILLVLWVILRMSGSQP